MQTQRTRQTIRCSASAYWRCVLDDEYGRRLYLDVLKYRDFKVLAAERDDGVVRRRIYVDPSMAGVPDAIAKAVKAFGDTSWVEESAFDVAARTLKLRYATSAMSTKTTMVGEVQCADVGDGTCERVQDTSVEVRLFGVGPLIEKAILADVKKTFDQTVADFTAAYAKEKAF